jgi:hypothetical protein
MLVPRYESGSTWKKAKIKAKLSKSRVKGARLRPLGLLFWLLFAAIFALHSHHPARASDTLNSPSVTNSNKSADLISSFTFIPVEILEVSYPKVQR